MREIEGDLAGRRIVLTGATGGIGRAVAQRLARADAELLLFGRRAHTLEGLASELRALAVVGDLTDRSFMSDVPGRVAELWGTAPDVLINNAGAFELAPFVDTDPATFDSLMAVNLRVPFELARVWLPDMIARGSGHIVNVGSIAGRIAFAGNAAYSASKFGLRGLHEVLVEELHGTGVRATWVEPSAVDTPLWDRFDPDSRPDLPSRKNMLIPEAVAEAVHFAVSRRDDVTIEEVVVRANPR
jgi:NADP-dependent 3-hydroxy acid dehydrogenase YdfG